MAWKSSHEDAPLMVHVMVGVSVFLIAVLTAWAAYKMYDVPARDWLKKKWFRK
jgi:peptidoglycan/LPS O-acetylase OafA/YrhL